MRATWRRIVAGVFTWEGRLLISVLAVLGALVAVFRTTQPALPPLAPPRDLPAPAAPGGGFARIVELYSGLRLEQGNRVEVLLNGTGTYPRLWADLAAARHSITVQSYYSQPGVMADTLAHILRARARDGVAVLVLLDAFGSMKMPAAWMNGLRSDGVRAEWLRPLRWQTLHDAANRSHVRAVVIDGVTAYTGGFGIADYWLGSGVARGEWRETNVRVTGPAAHQVQAAFGAAWVEATGELLAGPEFFPAAPAPDTAAPPGGAPQEAGLLFTTTTAGSTAAERFLALAVAGARSRLYVTNSYFVPNADFRRMLRDAVARGVDVRVLTAGPTTDVATTRHAGRRHYAELLDAGVRIYEYDQVMMHAKTISVDGAWAAIGSMNFDSRSLAFNDESMLVARDAGTAATLDSAFARDLAHAREITAAVFRARPWSERLLELAASLLGALL